MILALIGAIVSVLSSMLTGYIIDVINGYKIKNGNISQIHTEKDINSYKATTYFQMMANSYTGAQLGSSWYPGNQKFVRDLHKSNEQLQADLKKADNRGKEITEKDPYEIEAKIKPLTDTVTTNINEFMKLIKDKLKDTEKTLKGFCIPLAIQSPILIAHSGLLINNSDPNESVINKTLQNVIPSKRNQFFKEKADHNGSGNTYITNNVINPIDSTAFRQKLSNPGNNSIIKAHNSSSIKRSGKLY